MATSCLFLITANFLSQYEFEVKSKRTVLH